MSSISVLLKQILTAVYGREVRQSIHDAIEQCYSDVGDPTLNEAAFKKAVQAKIDDGSIAALTLGEGSIETKLIKNKAVTSEKIADEVLNSFKEEIITGGVVGGSGFSQPFKTALSNFMDGVAFVSDNGQALKNAVLDAMVITSDDGGTDEPVIVNIVDVADKTENASTGKDKIFVIYDVREGDTIEYFASFNVVHYNKPRYWDKAPIYSKDEVGELGDYTSAQTAYGGSLSANVPDDELTHEVLQAYSYGKCTFRPTRNYPTIVLRINVNDSNFEKVGATWTKVGR